MAPLGSGHSGSDDQRRDLAACAALDFILGGQPSLKSKALMREFGYWDGERVTETGAEAAADASGAGGDPFEGWTWLDRCPLCRSTGCGCLARRVPPASGKRP